MMPPVPRLADYGISQDFGFLPAEIPLQKLTSPYYEPWEAIAQNLQALILAKRIRQFVDNMPVLSVKWLEKEAEWRRAYVVLGYLTHSYIWGGEKPAQRLPASLSIPFQQVARYLELPPIATYAATCLWNWRPILEYETYDSLDNLATNITFTGSLDESWFYLVSIAIEAKGAPILPLAIHAISAARKGDADTVTICLQQFAKTVDEITSMVVRMHESCDPYVFYNKIRPFLAGSKNMEEAGLPNGVLYEDENGNLEYTKYAGGSNAQSSLVQAMDIFLDIKHRPTGQKKDGPEETSGSPAPQHNFLQEMRFYMPGPHRRFLEDLARVTNIYDFVCAREHDTVLTKAYDSCLEAVRTFRDKHIQIVSRYIIVPARETKRKAAAAQASSSGTAGSTAPSTAPSTVPRSQPSVIQGMALKTSSPAPRPVVESQKGGLASVKASSANTLKGTGGTDLIPFLKQSRDETTENAIGGEWVQRLVARRREEIVQEEKQLKEREGFVLGLASMWYSENGMGGLCSF